MVQRREVLAIKLYHQNSYILLSKSVPPFFLTQICVFYHKYRVIFTYCNVKYRQNADMQNEKLKMQTCFCRGESIESK